MKLKKSYNGIPAGELKQFLDEKCIQYNNPSFIESDPISIPHRFTSDRDREIAGFLTSVIAWGRRDLIQISSTLLMVAMDNNPYEFVISADKNDFMKGLKEIYSDFGSIEDVILEGMKESGSLREGLSYFRKQFFSLSHEKRAEKHFADIMAGAAGKRLNMFLRWMVRVDGKGVDFGIWKRINPSELYIPLDLHSGNTARRLGLLTRKTNDWKAVEELTSILREFDPSDPVKYDFALFSIGVNEKF